MKVATIYTYADPTTKDLFASKAKAFLNKSCKLAGVLPDLLNEKASPVKRYPYFNPGGPAIVGDVHLNVTKGVATLEICMGENGLFYRTKEGNQYGNNTFPCGWGRAVKADKYGEIEMSAVIKKFIQFPQNCMLQFR